MTVEFSHFFIFEATRKINRTQRMIRINEGQDMGEGATTEALIEINPLQ
jgi:hypothetical protein